MWRDWFTFLVVQLFEPHLVSPYDRPHPGIHFDPSHVRVRIHDFEPVPKC